MKIPKGNQMKVLVTGGTGFIGNNLARLLVENGNQVKCLVRKDSDIENLRDIGVELFVGDVTDEDSLRNIADDVDVVYHLAALVDHRKNIKSYQAHYDIGVAGTENLVKNCLDGKIKKFVYVSSIAAIGLRNRKKLLDETVECKPNTIYGKAKFEAEKMLLNYFNKNNFPVSIVRPPVIYGEGDSKGSIFSLTRFVNNRIRKNQPYPFFSQGKNITSLCYVKNLVKGFSIVGEKGKSGEIYHIADARPYTIREMVETIADVLRGNLKEISIPKSLIWLGSLCFEPLKMVGLNPPLYMRKYVEMTANSAFDISKIKGIGYNTEDNFRKYIESTINWYKENKLL